MEVTENDFDVISDLNTLMLLQLEDTPEGEPGKVKSSSTSRQNARQVDDKPSRPFLRSKIDMQFRCDLDRQPLTIDGIMHMSLDQLDQLEQRLIEIKRRHPEVLTKKSDHPPKARHTTPSKVIGHADKPAAPCHGSPEHRIWIWSQYMAMVCAVGASTECGDYAGPASPEIALILQRYEMQLNSVRQRHGKLSASNKHHHSKRLPDTSRQCSWKYKPELHQQLPSQCGSFSERHTTRSGRNYRRAPAVRLSALEDYRQQLRLLEVRNRERLSGTYKM